jgi:hypothetical protein
VIQRIGGHNVVGGSGLCGIDCGPPHKIRLKIRAAAVYEPPGQRRLTPHVTVVHTGIHAVRGLEHRRAAHPSLCEVPAESEIGLVGERVVV